MNTNKFQPGDFVEVAERYPLGHLRTPFYIRGKTGTIERVCGRFPNPEEIAYGRNGLPEKVLYRVRFKMHEVWPDYEGSENDVVEIEIYEHWLKAAQD